MPVLKNTRHEKFAQERAKGATIDAAYKAAGYISSRQNAHRLSTNEGIEARIRELQSEIAEKAEWTAADRLKMLNEIATAAKSTDPRVAVSAIAEANKMQGSHAAAKHEHTGANGGPIQTQEVSARDAVASKLASLTTGACSKADTG